MAFRDESKFVGQAVRSVLDQTFEDFELIAINDGSTDDSRRIIADFGDSRIRIIDLPKTGLAAALNRGILASRSPFIIRMDADDLCLPHRFECQLEAFENSQDLGLVGAQCAQIDEQGNYLNRYYPCPLTHSQIWKGMCRAGAQIIHPLATFRREAALVCGLYSERLRYGQEIEFFARLMLKYRAANLPEVLLLYRITRSAVSTKNRRAQLKSQAVVCRIIRRANDTGCVTLIDHDHLSPPWSQSDNASKRGIESVYQARRGRALLRGRRWSEAARAYCLSIRSEPIQWLAYSGLVRAWVRAGGNRPPHCMDLDRKHDSTREGASGDDESPDRFS